MYFSSLLLYSMLQSQCFRGPGPGGSDYEKCTCVSISQTKIRSPTVRLSWKPQVDMTNAFGTSVLVAISQKINAKYMRSDYKKCIHLLIKNSYEIINCYIFRIDVNRAAAGRCKWLPLSRTLLYCSLEHQLSVR